jgi:HAD superfamily hydrolase (TIGR01490 family)
LALTVGALYEALSARSVSVLFGSRLERVIGAAFFDLDRTFIRRSSALALAGAFRERGIITRRLFVKAAVWQLLFAARGASAQTVRNATQDGLRLLRGVPPAEVVELATGAVDTVLRPLVYADALRLAERHRARGEPVYLVTSSLQEIVDPLAAACGLDGAIGSLGEVGSDGLFTGRLLRACHGAGKAEAVRELAGAHELDLASSSAYSDGHSDLPLLEAVGRPVAVNPDRDLRRVARERGWPVLDFRRRSPRYVVV